MDLDVRRTAENYRFDLPIVDKVFGYIVTRYVLTNLLKNHSSLVKQELGRKLRLVTL